LEFAEFDNLEEKDIGSAMQQQVWETLPNNCLCNKG
jgi:hypothetical protein